MKVVDYNAENEAEEAKKFELLPAEKYNVVVDKSEDKVSDSGKNYTNFELKVTSGEHAGRIIFYNLYESSIFNKIVFAMSRCFGVEKIQDTAQDFLGKAGTINYSHKDYEGSPRGEINPFRGFLVKDETAVVEETPAKDEEEEPPF